MSIDIEEIRRRTNHAARGWPEDRVLTRLSVDVLDLCDALDTARAEIADLKLTAPLQAATILRAEKAEARLTTIQTMCDAAVEKKLRQRVPPFGAVVTVERLRAVLRSTA